MTPPSSRTRRLIASLIAGSALFFGMLVSAVPGAAATGESIGFYSLAIGGCAEPSSATHGRLVLQRDCRSSSANWRINAHVPLERGSSIDVTSSLKYGSTNLCLDTDYGRTTAGTAVVIGICTGSRTQMWHIVGGTSTDMHATTNLLVINAATQGAGNSMCLTAYAQKEAWAGGSANLDYIFPCISSWRNTNQDFVHVPWGDSYLP